MPRRPLLSRRRLDPPMRWWQSSARRVRLGLLVLIGLSLALALRSLDLIGPPPRVRIDALWVNRHAPLVQMMVISSGVALAATVLLLVFSRSRVVRFTAVGLWIAGTALAVTWFSDRLPIIIDVLRRYT